MSARKEEGAAYSPLTSAKRVWQGTIYGETLYRVVVREFGTRPDEQELSGVAPICEACELDALGDPRWVEVSGMEHRMRVLCVAMLALADERLTPALKVAIVKDARRRGMRCEYTFPGVPLRCEHLIGHDGAHKNGLFVNE